MRNEALNWDGLMKIFTISLISCLALKAVLSLFTWCMIETSSDLSRKSSEIFGNRRNVGRIFVNVRVANVKFLKNLRKSS